MTTTTQEELLPCIDTDAEYNRHYIPVHPDWEIQTKGKGSSFRIAHKKGRGRWLVTDERIHGILEQMARDIHAYASRTPPAEQPAAEGMTDAEIKKVRLCVVDSPEHRKHGFVTAFARTIEAHLASKREQPAGYVLDAKYEEAIAELAAEKDLTPLQVIKQALKLYQMHEKKFYAGCSPGPVPGYQNPAPQPDAAGFPELPDDVAEAIGFLRNYIQSRTAMRRLDLIVAGIRAYAQQAVAQKDARIEELEDEIEQMQLDEGVWPQWAETLLKMIRRKTGNDGYDDQDGVDLPGELSELFDVHAAELTALREQAARDREDAERYRWLTRHCYMQKTCTDTGVEYHLDNFRIVRGDKGQATDAAIDAAIAKEQK